MSDDYLLGLFDGEGCITTSEKLVRGRVYVALLVSVEMASEEATSMFAERFGGSVLRRPIPTAGGLTLWRWSINGAGAEPFLAIAAERLIVKRKQAEVGLKLARLSRAYSALRFGKRPDARALTDEEVEARRALSLELRALNGGRSRFAA